MLVEVFVLALLVLLVDIFEMGDPSNLEQGLMVVLTHGIGNICSHGDLVNNPHHAVVYDWSASPMQHCHLVVWCSRGTWI